MSCHFDNLLHTCRATDALELHAMNFMHSKESSACRVKRHLHTNSAPMLMQWHSTLPATSCQEHGTQQAFPGCQISDLFHGACLLWLGPGGLGRMATQICQWWTLTCMAVQKAVILSFQNPPTCPHTTPPLFKTRKPSQLVDCFSSEAAEI